MTGIVEIVIIGYLFINLVEKGEDSIIGKVIFLAFRLFLCVRN